MPHCFITYLFNYLLKAKISNGFIIAFFHNFVTSTTLINSIIIQINRYFFGRTGPRMMKVSYPIPLKGAAPDILIYIVHNDSVTDSDFQLFQCFLLCCPYLIEGLSGSFCHFFQGCPMLISFM